MASDCGLTSLARDLCWQHIDTYRAAARPLTMLQAKSMLEPAINLARLQIRASDGEPALRLLTSMYRAITTNTDLVIDGHTLPLTDLTGTRHPAPQTARMGVERLREGARGSAAADRIWQLAPAELVASATAEVLAEWGTGLKREYRDNADAAFADAQALLVAVGLIRLSTEGSSAAGAWQVHAAGARYATQAELADPKPDLQPSLFDDDQAGEG